MRASACAASLVLALTSSALAAEDRWYVDCYGKRCSMSRILPGEEGAGAAKFEITLGLHFERSTGKLAALAAMAPADADRDRGIEIGFRDTSSSQANKVVITVPLAPCDAASCMGSTEFDPSTASRDLQAEFVDNIHKYQMLTASYHAKGQRKTAMEDSGKFRAEYQNLLAEMKKPQ